MAFLQIKRDSIYLSIESTPKPIRPLMSESKGKFVYSIPACVQIINNVKKDRRRFMSLDTDFSRWLKNNPDPLWDLLDTKDKFDRDGKRQDFAVRPQHILPIWSYMDNDVKIVKQGNQFYDDMEKYDEGGGKVTDCDWMAWTEGSGFSKRYFTSRQDRSQFTPLIDPKLLAQKIQVLIQQALSDLVPFKTEDEMLRYIYGSVVEEAAAFPHGVNAPAQIPEQTGMPYNVMPAYMPGGTPPIQHGALPTPQQWQQPQPQPQPQPPQQQPQPPQQQWSPPGPQQQMPQQQVSQQQWTAPVPQQAWTPPAPQQAWTPPVPQQTSQPQWTPVQQPPAQQAPVQQPPTQWTPPQPQQQWTPPKVDVPNAPVTSQPVFAPPAQPSQQAQPMQVGGPGQVVVSGGKHDGKTLGWIKDNDASYLSFLKGNKKELAPAIEALLGGTQLPTQTPSAQPQAQQVNPDAEAVRSQLVKEINQKIMSIPEFQGQGVVTAMMPFLQQVIGTTKFSDAPIDQLQTLKMAVDTKLAPRA